MNKVILGLAVSIFVLAILASVLAFSFSLHHLNINAGSFLYLRAPARELPMSAGLEQGIGDDSAATIRFGPMQTEGQLCKQNLGPKAN